MHFFTYTLKNNLSLFHQDLRFVHELDNNETVMHHCFEESYEAFEQLSELYQKYIHDQSERCFVVGLEKNLMK